MESKERAQEERQAVDICASRPGQAAAVEAVEAGLEGCGGWPGVGAPSKGVQGGGRVGVTAGFAPCCCGGAGGMPAGFAD